MIVLFTGLLIIACSSKQPISRSYKSADLHYQKYVDLTLKGKHNAAAVLFDKTMVKLIEQDNMCALSRLHIAHYVLELPKKNATALKQAGQFATLDTCPAEKEIFNFLSGKPYEMKKLEEPYKTYAAYDQTKDVQILIKAADKTDLKPVVRSRLYRYAGLQLMQTDLSEAERYLLEAREIDRYNGWVAAIHSDLMILKDICTAQAKDCSHIEKRIELINRTLHKN